MSVLTSLVKGDIFKFGDKPWDSLHRFHSLNTIDNRYLIHFIGLSYSGDISKALANSFTWREEDIEVFIPKFYLCEFKKSKGKPCIPVSNHRIFLSDNLNPINLSNIFCSHNNYWYDIIY